MKVFNRESIDFFLPNEFKGLNKSYILDCMFNNKIQSKWKPAIGDIIVGDTGNVFVISGHSKLNEKLGGDKFYYGGGSCNRDGGNIMDSTYCYTMNESGINYGYNDAMDIVEIQDLYHSGFKNYRFVPYPHELKNYI